MPEHNQLLRELGLDVALHGELSQATERSFQRTIGALGAALSAGNGAGP